MNPFYIVADKLEKEFTMGRRGMAINVPDILHMLRELGDATPVLSADPVEFEFKPPIQNREQGGT
jgi:hypothetical protein